MCFLFQLFCLVQLNLIIAAYKYILETSTSYMNQFSLFIYYRKTAFEWYFLRSSVSF
jgi:hypothetical protein